MIGNKTVKEQSRIFGIAPFSCCGTLLFKENRLFLWNNNSKDTSCSYVTDGRILSNRER